MTQPNGNAKQQAEAGKKHMADPDEIIARDIRFGILGNAKRHWFGGDVIKTGLLDGLSIFLPEGERYFIRSLKHYAPQLQDRELAAEINGYSVQEAYHTREHRDYNLAMASLGYDVDEMEKPVRLGFDLTKNPLYQLALTCAIEHVTATLSSVILRKPDLLDEAEPAYRRLWMWHALEELEHKAVALDVFNEVTKDFSSWHRYVLRVVAMNATLIPFIMIVIRNLRLYAQKDGVKTGVRFWLRFVWITFFAPGYWRRCTLPALRYYLPWFDPRNRDDSQLVQKGRAWLAGEMSALATPAA